MNKTKTVIVFPRNEIEQREHERRRRRMYELKKESMKKGLL